MKGLQSEIKTIPFLNEIVRGDCVEKMKEIPDNSIAVCITNPPYNYEFAEHKWDPEEIKRRTARAKNFFYFGKKFTLRQRAVWRG